MISRLPRWLCMLLALQFLVACGGGDSDNFGLNGGSDTNTGTDGGTDTGGTTTTNTTVGSVTLTVLDSDLRMTANGTETTVARVTVLNTDSSPLSNITVTFSAELGSLSSATATTGSSGIAEVIFTAPTILGTGNISASASGITSAASTLTFVAGPPANITLIPNPGSVSLNGTATILATVSDANSHPVESNLLVFSIADNQSGGSLSTTSASTDVNGQASVTYTAGTTSSSTDTISVRASNGQTQATTVSVTAASVIVDTVTLQLGASSIVADGSASAAVRATVRDTNGTGIAGIAVNFATTLGGLSDASAVTDANGVAQVTLTSSTTLGLATVTAAASGFSQTGTVSFVTGAPSSFAITASPGAIGVGDSTTILAVVSDSLGHVISGETVTFNVSTNNSAGSLASLTATTNINGVAQAVYTAGSTAGTDTITALSQTIGSVSGSVNVTVNASTVPVNSVAMFSGASSLAADGSSETLIRATVRDGSGDAIAGKAVSFTASAGSFSGGVNSDVTDANGEATVTLVSSTNLGGAVITANSDGVRGTTTVQFVAGEASAVTVTAAPSQLNFGAVTSLSVEVMDAQGHPVSGEVVAFSVSTNVSGGLLAATQASTDTNGRATVTYTAGNVAGSDVVTARLVNGTSNTRTLTVSADAAKLGSLTLVEPNGAGEIVANGSSFTLLRATVLDINNLPVEGADVAFVTSVGDFNSASSGTTSTTVTTDSSGLAEVELYSRTTVDTAQVTSSVGGFNKSLSINFVPGVPSATNSTISSSPASLPADGSSQTTVTVTLVDGNGNRVEDGTSITLRTTAGVIASTNPVQTSSGKATFTLTSSAESGIASLTVKEVNGLSGSVSFGSNSDNDAANIVLSAAQSGLSVAGVGQTENTTVNISIVEVDGDPINESNWNAGVNTARVSFVSRPNGGEFLSGVDASGTVVDTTATGSMDIVTTNGSAQVNLQAGTLPGVVEIQVEALDQTGVPYGNPVRASLSQVSIASGPAHTLVFSFPVTNAIENLNDATPRVPGFYRRNGGLTVTDRYGNAVPDGTVINLGLTDSIIAFGTAGATTAGNASLTDAGVRLSDGTATTFDGAMITRSGTDRFIEQNDRVIVFDAQAEDKARFVTSTAATTVSVQNNYANSDAGLSYVVGASLLGASIAGVDDSGVLTNGRAVTKDGLAQLRFTYPADINSIYTGVNSDLDTRVQPYNSGRVFLIAQASDSGATVINGSTGFNAISGFTVTPVVSKLSGSATVSVEVEDGGDKVRVPFSATSAVAALDTVGKFDACAVFAVNHTEFADEPSCTAAGFTFSGGICVDPISNEADCNAAGLDYYAGALCINRFVTEEDPCVAVVNRSWITNLSSLFNVSVFVGSPFDGSGRILSTDTHTTRVPVHTDTNGDAINDFYVHGFTNSSGVVEVKVVVSGSPFLVSGDTATVTISSGDGTGTLSVEIP